MGDSNRAGELAIQRHPIAAAAGGGDERALTNDFREAIDLEHIVVHLALDLGTILLANVIDHLQELARILFRM